MQRLHLTAQLANFTIGLTDVSPSNRTPTALKDKDYMQCSHYTGTFPRGQTVDIECSTRSPRGRYVFLLRRGRNLYLDMCELEVYAWTSKYPWRILITYSSSLQGDRGTLSCARWRYTARIAVAVLCLTMHRLFVTYQVVVNAFHLSIYCRFQRVNMYVRFKLPASLRRADVLQRNMFFAFRFPTFLPFPLFSFTYIT